MFSMYMVGAYVRKRLPLSLIERTAGRFIHKSGAALGQVPGVVQLADSQVRRIL
jgi:hypothetical protein